MLKLNGYADLLGRILISTIFVLSGVNKINGYEGTQGFMESMGVPGMLLPLVIIVEILGGLAIMVGWQTRISAFALAGFTMLSAFLFHFDLSDQTQFIMFLKNLAIAGGFLIIMARGAGELSLDHKFGKQ